MVRILGSVAIKMVTFIDSLTVWLLWFVVTQTTLKDLPTNNVARFSSLMLKVATDHHQVFSLRYALNSHFKITAR